mmetsp:Transcript_72672/g.235163  ORF Transcript_72672/g.235163 Transcript_72672/m.235163 type:complete len:99 (-) Transcript_72672:126-422(-)
MCPRMFRSEPALALGAAAAKLLVSAAASSGASDDMEVVAEDADAKYCEAASQAPDGDASSCGRKSCSSDGLCRPKGPLGQERTHPARHQGSPWSVWRW